MPIHKKILGPIIGGVFSASSARRQNKLARQQADTVYQRGVKDLRAAGLNPMLAIGKASPQAPVVNEGQPAINSALTAYKNRAEVKNLEAQNQLLQSQNQKTQAETTLVQTGIPLAKSKQIAGQAVLDTATSADALIRRKIQEAKTAYELRNENRVNKILKRRNDIRKRRGDKRRKRRKEGKAFVEKYWSNFP